MASGSDDAEKKLRFIEEITSDVDGVQERVLAEILGRNGDAEYLKSFGLDGRTDRPTFRAKVPLVSYADLRPYIERIADGDRSPILSTHPISEFYISSGTSGGVRKLAPSVGDELERRRALNSLIMPVVSSCLPGIDKGKGLYFLFVRAASKTPGGVVMQPGLSSYYRSKEHGCDEYTSPREAVLCEDTSQSMYAQMLCGLRRRHDVVRVGAVFAAVLLRSIHFLQLNWEQLAADIESGVVDAARVADPAVRQAATRVLGPADPGLARFVRDECSKGDWAGIVTRIWPNARYLDAIVTGAMAQYVPALRYYGGAGLPLVSTKYASSECELGINLSPLCDPAEVSYTIMPNMGYFEFLPLQPTTTTTPSSATGDPDANTASQLVELADVEAGREYELVVTTHAGLSRYRVGDVLRVTGFHNAAPQFRFVRRENVLLSVDVDKTDEAELQHAVELASALLRPHGASVADYTAQACTRRIPGHYVVYWELLHTDEQAVTTIAKETLDSCCLTMEEGLSIVYRICRAVAGSIGPLEIRVVRRGTFAELMDYAVSSHGASVNQYKVPRCVSLPPVLELLDARVVSTHFSTGLPRITPIN